MKDSYKILGLNENCSDEELDRTYYELRAKYSEERFLEGEAGNVAAKKLTEIETAYNDICSARKEAGFSQGETSGFYKEIEELIKNGDLTTAQQKLDEFNDRPAEWHYLQSVIFYKKNWTNESKKQLEIAMQLDKDNKKYKDSYDKLVNKINSNNSKAFSSYSDGSDRRQSRAYYDDDRQMGGDGCIEWCCEMAVCNMLLNCCCNCR